MNITDINSKEIAIMRTNTLSNNHDINNDDDINNFNESLPVLNKAGNQIKGLKQGYINLPYAPKSDGDIIVENHGSFLRYQTENDYAFDISEDCGSNSEEIGELLYKSLKDEYGNERLEKNEVYYNTLISLKNVYYQDTPIAYAKDGTDNITIHAHNNKQSRKNISILIKRLNPSFYSAWKKELEPRAIKASNKINA